MAPVASVHACTVLRRHVRHVILVHHAKLKRVHHQAAAVAVPAHRLRAVRTVVRRQESVVDSEKGDRVARHVHSHASLVAVAYSAGNLKRVW